MPTKVRIVCISDTHNAAPGEGYKLPEGDVLIHAGDLTNQGSWPEMRKVVKWLSEAKFEVKLVVGGWLGR
jgi:3',5'-cyclic AMP phosphodiesterase CpdA